MTTDDGLGDPLAREEPPRDRWGRVLLPDENGKSTAYTRATTLAKALSGEKPGLVAWKLRLAVHGVVGNRTLHNLVAVTPITDRETLNDIVQRALAYAGADEGRTKGSTLHSACARARAVPGSYDALPDDLKADVTAYAKCLTANGVELDVELIERMVVNDAVRSAGSFDDVVTVKGLDGRYVFDLKTAQDLSYEDAQAEIEIQLAVYANANAMVPKRWVGGRGRAQLEPMPEGVSKRWAIVAHLPAGSATCTLHWVDIRRGWERAKLAFEARKKGVGFVAWDNVALAAERRAIAGAGLQDLVPMSEGAAEAYDAAAVAEIEAGRDGGDAVDGNPELGGSSIEPEREPEKPKRKRRSRAEIERDNAAKAAALMPALDVAGGDRATVQALAQGPEAEADRAEAARLLASPGVAYGTSGGALINPGEPGVSVTWGDVPTVDPELDAAVAADPDDPGAVLEGARLGALTERAIPAVPGGDVLAIDVSDAALDESLAARDLRVRDEILAERKRIRIDGEIRAAIEDATKAGTPKDRARKHLALAYDLWASDWAPEHTEMGKSRLAAL